MKFYDVDGRFRRVSCEAKTLKSEAQSLCAAHRKAIQQAPLTGLKSIDEILKPEAPKAPMTLAEAAKVYRDHQAVECEPETFRRYENILKNHIIPTFGKMAFKAIKPG